MNKALARPLGMQGMGVACRGSQRDFPACIMLERSSETSFMTSTWNGSQPLVERWWYLPPNTPNVAC